MCGVKLNFVLSVALCGGYRLRVFELYIATSKLLKYTYLELEIIHPVIVRVLTF